MKPIKRFMPAVVFLSSLLAPVLGSTDSTTTESFTEKASKLFSAGKEIVSKGADTVASKSAETWDATREGAAKVTDATKEVSKKAWDTTKEGAAKATDATTDLATRSWSKTKDVSKGAADYTTQKVGKISDLLSSGETSEPVVAIEKNTD
ncbi:MAG: hypothetical protein GKR95_20655 [Gammaproteobacteria bacterium]|nr:hypothetical protein [Gammaproteobacteria bacterium]